MQWLMLSSSSAQQEMFWPQKKVQYPYRRSFTEELQQKGTVLLSYFLHGGSLAKKVQYPYRSSSTEELQQKGTVPLS